MKAVNLNKSTEQTEILYPQFNRMNFSSVWREHIRPNIGQAIGDIIGGPIGDIAGSFVQSQINKCSNARAIAIQRGFNPSEMRQSNLSLIEQNKLKSFIDRNLTPTSKYIIKSIDNESVKSSGLLTASFIEKCNMGLKEAASLKAYSTFISRYGEKNASSNFIIEKTEAINEFVDVIEKSIIKHLHNKLTGYKVVLENFNTSNINYVGNISLDWQNKRATAKSKKYVRITNDSTPPNIEIAIETNPNDNDIENVIINSPESEQLEVTNTTEVIAAKNKNSFVIIGLLVATGIVAYSVLPEGTKEE
ncbi:hypothetical protein [Bizionia sp.]|uniref:hypothetical protein n=1 Tax=Bizionia sp. TaxID=1954480 RepID=UPI003A8E0D7C